MLEGNELRTSPWDMIYDGDWFYRVATGGNITSKDFANLQNFIDRLTVNYFEAGLDGEAILEDLKSNMLADGYDISTIDTFIDTWFLPTVNEMRTERDKEDFITKTMGGQEYAVMPNRFIIELKVRLK